MTEEDNNFYVKTWGWGLQFENEPRVYSEKNSLIFKKQNLRILEEKKTKTEESSLVHTVAQNRDTLF